MNTENKILVVRKMSALEFHYNNDKEKNAAQIDEDIIQGDKEQREYVQNILKKLQENNYLTTVVTREGISKELVNQHDYVFSLGGDGTVIATAAFNKDKPQLNLKNDKRSKGNLCVQNTEQALEDFFNDNYKIQKWTRQDVYLNNKFFGRALNETCIGEDGLNLSKMAKYDLNGKYGECSGLVIVTGTGSTGWPKVFKPYPKTSKEFRFDTAFLAEGPEKGVENYFKIKYLNHKGTIALDTIKYDIPRNSVLEIKLSENPLKVIV